MKKNYSHCLSSHQQIFVNDLFQISSFNPGDNPTAAGVKANIFAFGDVCLTSLNEPKSIPSIKSLSDCVTKNIIQMSLGQEPSNQIPSRIIFACFMSLGPDYGIMQLNGLLKFGPGVAKEKITFMDKTQATYRDGNIAIFQETVGTFKNIAKITRCIGCCCPCIPIGINHSIVEKKPNPRSGQIYE